MQPLYQAEMTWLSVACTRQLTSRRFGRNQAWWAEMKTTLTSWFGVNNLALTTEVFMSISIYYRYYYLLNVVFILKMINTIHVWVPRNHLSIMLWPLSVINYSYNFVEIDKSCILYVFVMITSLLRQNDVATSFWRNSEVVVASCVRCVSSPRFTQTLAFSPTHSLIQSRTGPGFPYIDISLDHWNPGVSVAMENHSISWKVKEICWNGKNPGIWMCHSWKNHWILQ